MRRPTWTYGRRGAALAASAAVCAAALTTAYAVNGGTGREGYVAIGAAGGRTPGTVQPTGEVRLVPLDDPKGTANSRSGNRDTAGDDTATALSPTDSSSPSAHSSSPPSGSSPTGTVIVPPPEDDRPQETASPSATPSPEPALLTVGTPARTATDQRWCETVTLPLRNSGGTAVTSGTVAFGTHVIGSLGIDWATIKSTQPLPVPIAPGADTRRSWTVCVEAWRVPLGMHIETRDVTVDWT